MKKNMGTIDRVIRILVAVVMVVLYFTTRNFRYIGNYSVNPVRYFCCDKFNRYLSALLAVSVSVPERKE